MDRLPPWEQLDTLRSELEYDFSVGIEERRKRKKDRIDEILDMLIIAYMFGNESANTMLFGEADNDTEFEPVIPIDTDEMKRAIYRKIADKDWEQRVTEYFDAEDGTVDEIVRVVDTDLNRIYNDAILNVGEQANRNGTVMKTWQTMEDERVRSTHEFINGVTIPIGDRFWTWDGDSARYPGDFSDPANVVGCRCRLLLST